MNILLHSWQGNEWGWSLWSLDHLGFSTWAPTHEKVLDKALVKLGAYQQWLYWHESSHGREACVDTNSNYKTDFADRDITIVEEVAGNEVTFGRDLESTEPDEMMRCLRLLEFTRPDLLNIVDNLPDELLDWDPPYQHFAKWAHWRSIRQIPVHTAMTEVGYYLPDIGYRTAVYTNPNGRSWRERLIITRQGTQQFLVELARSRDKARVSSGARPDRCGKCCDGSFSTTCYT